MRHLIALSILGLTLAACSGKITKDDCQEANYYEMGVEDGQDGKTAERLDRYREACSREGLAVQEERYQYGRQVGLVEYCDAKKGRRDAKELASDPICQQAKVPPYQRAYEEQVGERRQSLQKEIDALAKQRDALEQQQQKLRSELEKLNSQSGM